MKYKLAVFDMDGTILDTLEDLTISTNYALERAGLPARSIEEIRQFVGNGVRMLIKRAAAAAGDPDAAARTEQIFDDFFAHYTAHCADHTKPYAGIPELLRRLKEEGCLLAVVSNKADPAVQDLCRVHFPGLFDCALGEKPGIAKKPAPDMVNAVLAQLHLGREDAVYIGDSEVDIQTAANAGLDAVIVTWGFRDAPFLSEQGAKDPVDTPQEVYGRIMNL